MKLAILLLVIAGHVMPSTMIAPQKQFLLMVSLASYPIDSIGNHLGPEGPREGTKHRPGTYLGPYLSSFDEVGTQVKRRF